VSADELVPELVADVSNCLAEGIIWHAPMNSVFWLDIYPDSTLYSMDISTGIVRSRKLSSNVYCIRRENDFAAIGLTQNGLARIHLESMLITGTKSYSEIDKHLRFNDANCDQLGRLWTGTMPDLSAAKDPLVRGALFRIDLDGALRQVDSDFGCPNTFAWTADNKTMYCADSASGWIYAYDFDLKAGAVSNRRKFFVGEEFGIPDGSAIDTEDHLWNARWGGGAVLRIGPHGRISDRIKFPVANVTDCVFAGEDLTTLFVTTAKFGLGGKALRLQPGAGGIFAIQTNFTGTLKGTSRVEFEH